MPNKLQYDEPKDEMKREECESIDKRIREQVIHALGRPIDLRDVQVRKVWDDHYRVNVIVGSNAGSVRVANSFFLIIDNNGSLITATPTITKRY